MASRRRRGDPEEEQEATAIDLRRSALLAAAEQSAKEVPVKKARPPAPPLVDDESDEDATEFLAMRPPVAPSGSPPVPRPGSAEPAMRGHGRAIPLDESPSSPAVQRRPRPNADVPLDLEVLPRIPRPLPRRENNGPHPAAANAAPHITRIPLSEGEHPGTRDEEPEAAPLGSVESHGLAKGIEKAKADAAVRASTLVHFADDDETMAPDKRQPSVTTEAPSAPLPSAEDTDDGILVVEAPQEAVVIVNGVERGRGIVRVTGLDRHIRYAVRIHCPGHLPWSGSVTLDGKMAAKIRPTLKPRPR